MFYHLFLNSHRNGSGSGFAHNGSLRTYWQRHQLTVSLFCGKHDGKFYGKLHVFIVT